MVEEEDPQEEEMEEETEEEEVANHEAHLEVHQEAHQVEETQCPPDPTYLLTYDPSPVLKMRNQWGNSPMSSAGTEPKQRHSSTSSTTTSSSTLMSQGSTPQSKRSPLVSHSLKEPTSQDGQGP